MTLLSITVVILAVSISACSSPSSNDSAQAGGGGQSQMPAGGKSNAMAGASGMAFGGAGAGGAAGSSGMGGRESGGTAGSGGTPQKPVCPPGPFPAPRPGAARNVCEGFDYAHGYNEGPTWIAAEGAFFFSNFVQGAARGDLSGDIIKYTPGGDCERYFENVGTNGLAVSADGNLLGASHKTRSISKFNLTTRGITIVADKYMDKLLDSPNDLILHSNGTLYFTNPVYELGGRPQGVGPAIFRRDPSGSLHVIQQGGAPNGIALSPDEDRLYVVGAGMFELDESGVPEGRKDFPLNADGLAVDCAGNVYTSGGTIRDQSGKTIGSFRGGTNLAFGGEDGKTLFVVGGGTGTHVVEMNVPGLP